MKTVWDQTRIKGMELKNRFVRAALWMKMAEADGHINEDLISVYEDLAKGDVGLILTGYATISKDEQPNPRMMGIYDDSFIEEYKEMTDRVHKHGSKIALQIVLGGSQNHHPDRDAMKILGPSAVENRVTKVRPKEASIEELGMVADMFADAALRVKKAGFDAVQLHGAHGYFLSQFLTPYYNRRKDQYGGSLENRSRILVQVVEAVRKAVGQDYPVMMKVNYDDFMDPGQGLELEESIEVFKILDRAGVDVFEVSAVNESSGKGLAPAFTRCLKKEKQSYFRDATKQIADAVDAKVILMGGNRNIEVMESVLNESSIEYVSMARPLLSEPNLIKIWEDDPVYSPKCVACNKCWETEPNSCIFNR